MKHIARCMFICLPVLAFLAGCGTTPKGLFVLLADPDGRAGEVRVANRGGKQVLSRPLEALTVEDGYTAPSQPAVMDEGRVKEIFGAALAAEPEPPVRYVLYFAAGAADLNDESLRLIPQILSSIDGRRSTWIGVVGHTDRVGSREQNYTLSLSRARKVRDVLASKGVDGRLIEVRSHGEDNPQVPTDDGVPEPRNRRVEVVVR